jgi:hypothetical protein
MKRFLIEIATSDLIFTLSGGEDQKPSWNSIENTVSKKHI